MPLTVTRAAENPRAYPFGSRVHHQTAIREVDIDREKNQRKRISVACSRCRKRKIKCSGDLGNGQGCTNCKAAGADPSQCQFLRVNSQPTGFGTAQFEWPYQVGGYPGAPTMANHPVMNPYYVPPAAALPSSSYHGPMRPTRPLPSPSHFTQSGGQEYYGHSITNEQMDPYLYQAGAAQHFSAGNDNSSSPAMYPSHEDVKPWPAVVPSQRGAPATWDPELGAYRHPQPAPAAYSGITPGASASPDPPNVFSGMNGLITAAMSERLLPNPLANPALPSTSEAPHPSLHAYNPEVKAQGPWPGIEGGNGSETSPSALGSAKSSSSPSGSTSSEAPNYGMVPSSRASQSSSTGSISTPSVSPGGCEAESSLLTHPATHYHHGLAIAPSSAAPTSTPTSATSIPATQYAYALGGKHGGSPHPAEGTLLNDQPYTHLAHRPVPQATQANGNNGRLPAMETGRRGELTGMARSASTSRSATVTQ